jgi:hypothetical protein
VVTERERFGRFGRTPVRADVSRGHGPA